MATINDYELEKIHSLLFAKLYHAFMECSDEVQAAVREMIAITEDPEADDVEREMALATIAEALFPKPHDGEVGIELEESERTESQHAHETRKVLDEMDREEANFAERLRSLMEQRGMTQAQLAEKIGVGQPAISMMLNRQCRPQRRTVVRIAEALSVAHEELWPTSP